MPENTMAAIESAIELRVDMVEVDIRFGTKNGQHGVILILETTV